MTSAGNSSSSGGSTPQQLHHLPLHIHASSSSGSSATSLSSNHTPTTSNRFNTNNHNRHHHSYDPVRNCSPPEAPVVLSDRAGHNGGGDRNNDAMIVLEDPDDDEDESENHYYQPQQPYRSWISILVDEIVSSAELIFLRSKLCVLLICGVVAVIGDFTHLLGEAACFALSGIALIPCAERCVLSCCSQKLACEKATEISTSHNKYFRLFVFFVVVVAVSQHFCIVSCSLSFLTEQVAEHTNGTIGALLNATFGNAPELLIAVAALRSGFYRVVQLAMLGSILTNMILVFGVACLIGGLRWQVQVLRLTSGNVSVVMLLASTAGFLFPAALLLAGQIGEKSSGNNNNNTNNNNINYTNNTIPLGEDEHTAAEVTFCRVNAAVMMILYVLFLVFTLGTHQSEFADQPLRNHSDKRAQRNLFCLFQFRRAHRLVVHRTSSLSALRGRGMELVPLGGVGAAVVASKPYELLTGQTSTKAKTSTRGEEDGSFSYDEDDDHDIVTSHNKSQSLPPVQRLADYGEANSPSPLHRRPSSLNGGRASENERSAEASTTGAVEERGGGLSHAEVLRGSDTATTPPRLPPSHSHEHRATRSHLTHSHNQTRGGDYHRHHLNPSPPSSPRISPVSKSSANNLLGPMSPMVFYDLEEDGDPNESEPDGLSVTQSSDNDGPLISMRIGIFWLFIVTLCISALSDILVDTIDGFAERMHLSEVFTSMVVVPFFSNVAEQVSAFLFAYRNEMDLVVGVTIGSAIQIASFVLPGSVLIGMVMDRSMTLYFRGYETVCMLFGVVVVGAVLQGGTTNWLVGAGTLRCPNASVWNWNVAK